MFTIHAMVGKRRNQINMPRLYAYTSLACAGLKPMRAVAARGAGMIRVDAVWLATEPLDMRAGVDSALARVVKVFGAAHPHTAYLLANRRANRMKVLVGTMASGSGWQPDDCMLATFSGHIVYLLLAVL
jgi:hypothetical protein